MARDRTSPACGALLAVAVAICGGCGAAQLPPASHHEPLRASAGTQAPSDPVPPPQPATAVASAELPPGPPRACVAPWSETSEPVVATHEGRYVDGAGAVCARVVMHFESLRWHDLMAVHRLAAVRERLQRLDPRAAVEVTVGRPPLGVATSPADLARVGIPASAVPARFSFESHDLVRTEWRHSPQRSCRDGLLGLHGAQYQRLLRERERWRQRAEVLATRWVVRPALQVRELYGAQVISVDSAGREAAAAEAGGACLDSYIWQPAVVAVPKSASPRRVALP